MNFLKAGLATSSAAVLVSPSYANEVQTNELGCGMDKVLRSVGNFGSDVDLGFLNGDVRQAAGHRQRHRRRRVESRDGSPHPSAL